MSIKPDWWIHKMVESNKMIDPFTIKQVNRNSRGKIICWNFENLNL